MKVELLQPYVADDRLSSHLSKFLSAPLQQEENANPLRIRFDGLIGSSRALIAAACFQKINESSRRSFVFILNDKDEAAYFQNDLQHFIEKKDVLFLGDSFRKPGHYEELQNNRIQLRTEVINRIANSVTKNEIVVTYPEALMEKVVNSRSLQKATLFIKLNQELDEDKALEMLISYGFERVDFVYEPGQFAIRGGIIDIFSFGNDLPYRVELSGSEVESIRMFDPLSQLSQRKISQVTIVPNIQTQFSSSEKTSFLEVIPDNSILCFQDIFYAEEKIGADFEKASQQFQKASEMKVEGAPKHAAEFFIDSTIFRNELENFSIIEFGTKFYFPEAERVAFDIQPQPSLNKNFGLLIANLKKFRRDGFSVFIFSDNVQQLKRLDAIFDDLKADVTYQPVSFAIEEGFIDNERKIACFTDHQIFDRYHHYHLKQGYSKSNALNIKLLRELKPGDYVTHIDHGVGVFSGLEKLDVNGQQQEAVRLIYRDNDLLYVSIQSLHKISKYVGKDGTPPRVNKLGTEAWEQLKRKVKSKVKDISKELIALYAKRKATKGFAFSPDSYLQTELEASFIYEDTPDQLKATNDVKRDMEKDYPMDRLICGDVGFGKTEVAIRAAFKAVCDSKQVAVLVPTTILALQHYKTFSDRLKDFPCTVDFLNRFKTSAQQKETLQKLEEGKIDIIIGTTSIIGQKVKFKDLGLLIIDEEQKFGVSAKEKLRQLRAHVDTLTLTATPIPRTLQFSLLGARDLSIINTPPPNRQPIETEMMIFNPEQIKEEVEFEIGRGGQVFFIHNRVRDIQEVASMIHGIAPEVDITVAHGQLESQELEEKMIDFIEQRHDVLVCTNIVESGLDIPNANTIIINDAQMFGLSDLHQLRGRVGRSNKKAFCYLMTPPLSVLTQEAKKRLKTIEEFAELGSGFQIAMRDMDIRGAGNLLGAEQSGFIADIGYDTYQKILDEAVRELKQTEFKDVFEEELKEEKTFTKECTIDSDAEMLIPDEYVSNINERLILYTELDNISDEEGLKKFEEKLLDRFGPIPKEVKELLDGVRLRTIARQLGFEKLQQRNGVLKCYTIENPESLYYDSEIFARILGFVAQNPQQCSLKQLEKNMLITLRGVKTLHQAKQTMQRMLDAATVVESRN